MTEDREVLPRSSETLGSAAESSQQRLWKWPSRPPSIGYPAASSIRSVGWAPDLRATGRSQALPKVFTMSDQTAIDQDLRGWKEVEYEVVRDCRDNRITVCNMENFDRSACTRATPSSLPSQTLSNLSLQASKACAKGRAPPRHHWRVQHSVRA